MLCPQQVGAQLLYPQHRHPRWLTLLFRDPLGQLRELIGRLYLERSSSRIEEYRDFKPLPGESTPNMVNRLDLLHMQIGGPEIEAFTKLLDALRKDMGTEVQQKVVSSLCTHGRLNCPSCR
jgi:hypothetical protein